MYASSKGYGTRALAECLTGSNDGKDSSEVDIGICKCGVHKNFCSVEGCQSIYCPVAQAAGTDDFVHCYGCDRIHCANHDFSECIQCDNLICILNPPQCRICGEAVCEDCDMGHHEVSCVRARGITNPKYMSAVEREIMGCGLWSDVSKRVTQEEADSSGSGDEDEGSCASNSDAEDEEDGSAAHPGSLGLF